jgi:Dopey, N-terminal
LTPTLSFASLAARPVFLSLLETYLLPVNASALRAALKALILALLPGLEEETSEDFERTLRLLEGLRDAVRTKQATQGEPEGAGDNYFWQSFFLASITSASRRQGALAFLVRKLPKLGANSSNHNEVSSAVQSVVSPEPGLLIRCFAVGLSDDQLLVQRGFLDLLVTHLPLNSPVLQKRVIPEDLDRLLVSAAGVVVRRDMSLNRRLWTWFLGPEEPTGAGTDSGPGSPILHSTDDTTTLRSNAGSARTQYFGRYGLHALVRGIRGLIDRSHKSPTERARPFRICLSLMDRWEIGGLVVPEIFLPIINSVREYEHVAATKEQFNEVLRSASVFFDGIESGLIWGELAGLTASAIRDQSLGFEVRLDKLRLVKFVVTHFNVREEEMLVVHIPVVVLALLVMVREADSTRLEETGKDHDGSHNLLALAVVIAQDLIDMIPERAFLMGTSTADTMALGRQQRQSTIPSKDILDNIQRFYVQDQGSLEVSSAPFSPRDTSELLLREASYIVSRVLLSCPSDDGLEPRTKLFVTLLSKAPSSETLKNANLFSTFQQLLEPPALNSRCLPFSTFSAVISSVCSLHTRSYLSSDQVSELTPWLVRQAWGYISPTNPKYHLETVRCLWQLQSAISPYSHGIEAAISTIMTENDVSGTLSVRGADAGRTFATLWTHSVQGSGGLGETGNDIFETQNGGNRGNKRRNTMRAYEYMLTRPLFLLLDALGDETTELFVFTRGWLQNLSSVDK